MTQTQPCIESGSVDVEEMLERSEVFLVDTRQAWNILCCNLCSFEGKLEYLQSDLAMRLALSIVYIHILQQNTATLDL